MYRAPSIHRGNGEHLEIREGFANVSEHIGHVDARELLQLRRLHFEAFEQ